MTEDGFHKKNQTWLLLLISFLLPFHAHGQTEIALMEMQTIAQGMDACAINTNRYVVPEALNDTTNDLSNPAYNYINDGGGTFVLVPQEGVFGASRVNLITAPLPWNGPYLTYQPSNTQTAPTPYDIGSPLDPWGMPFLLFSPFGLLRGDTGQATLEYYADQFAQYTLVSLGVDGVMNGNDLFYTFGPAVLRFGISSIRTTGGALLQSSREQKAGARTTDSFSATAGSTVVIRGLNLGASQTGAQVFWGTTELLDVTGWTSREITVTLPQVLSGEEQVTVHRGTSITNGLTLKITPPLAAAADWNLYQ